VGHLQTPASWCAAFLVIDDTDTRRAMVMPNVAPSDIIVTFTK